MNAVRRFAARCVVPLALTVCSTAMAQAPAGPLRPGYSGVLTLDVDATDIERRIFRVKESIPVAPGTLRLYYPQWVPGNHAPTGLITLLTGLRVSAAGREIAWRRDPLNVFGFDIAVPEGASTIDLEFQYLSPLVPAQGRIVVTPALLGLEWHKVVLYPAGVHSDGIRVRASVTLPRDWAFASSLDVEGSAGGTVRFAPTSLTELVDSPVWAGRHFRKVELDPAATAPVDMDVFADGPGSLAIEPEQIAAFRAMVQQTYKVFGPPYYRRYELLLALSDDFSGIATEHQASTEIRRPPAFFTKWKTLAPERSVVPHEFVHAWIGKKHRPLDLATPNYNVPMSNTLLWSYEGETDYWAYVLTCRSGLLTKEQTLESIARAAAAMDARAGRSWRDIQDTTNDAIMRYDRSRDWLSWQRGVDYYAEGLFLWMDVDARLRELSGGQRSMDDFARSFHGGLDRTRPVATYTADDIVSALNAVAPDDWRAFLRERLESKTRRSAVEALRASGWRLVFKDKPGEYAEAADRENSVGDFGNSLGFYVGKGDQVQNVVWDGPAFGAGLTGGATLLAVDGRSYKADLLKGAIAAAKESAEPIALLVKTGDLYKTVTIRYRGGLRYPHLERIDESADRLSAMLEPLR